MRERPILFSGELVRALLAGRKTQTRRPVKLNYAGRAERGGRQWHIEDPDARLACPYGVPGDRLWVRETWAESESDSGPCLLWKAGGAALVGATGERRRDWREFLIWADVVNPSPIKAWRPSIFMPRWASRLTLEITDVRVQRLQEISEEDALAEGIPTRTYTDGRGFEPATVGFRAKWREIYDGDPSWDANTWVWALTFKVIR